MDALLINMILALVEGFALIISPCILPILPIILSGSLQGGKSRPIGIICGFVIAFTFITLFSKLLVQYTHLSPESLRNASYVLLVLLGLIMVSTYLTEKFSTLTRAFSNVGSHLSGVNSAEGGFLGGMLFGGLVGIVWTPCAGPILAAVIVQAIVQQTTVGSLLVVIAFGIGAGLPMLIIALVGRKIMQKFTFFRNRAILFRKILGVIIIASVFLLMYYTNLTISVAQSNVKQSNPISLMNGLEKPYPAPPIQGISAWINSPPLSLDQLKGKVVLMDFWTYSCINCIRTLPYLKDWYAKYHDKGFVIIGVHSPEFEFEKKLPNVKNAVKQYHITYPVALDNQFVTWQNYRNKYWPAHYLIDKSGEVVYQHFGEGEYDTTENNIRYLLGVEGKASELPDDHYSSNQTPETYLGYARMENFGSVEPVVRNRPASYHYPKDLKEDQWALQGDWAIYPDKIISITKGAAIKLNFTAGNVYAVMGRANIPVEITVSYQGKIPATINHKSNTRAGQLMVSENQLYTIVSLSREGSGIIEMKADQPGLEVYTFTFGAPVVE